MDNYLELQHVSVIVSDIGKALHFYHEVLGMPINPARPDLGYPGAWLNIGNQQLHLLELPNPDPVSGRPAHAGRDRHCAMAVRELEMLRQKLENASIPYTLSRSGRRALFCRDPDGNALEFIQV